MKKKSMISIAVVSVFLLMGIDFVALAGTDLQPLKKQPFKKQLPAVEKVDSPAQATVEPVERLTLVPAFPGAYGISLRWIDPNGEVHVRVGIYSFRSDNTFRADYWEWGSNDKGKTVLADIIGWGPPIRPIYKDYAKRIVTDDKFYSHDLKSEWGNWKSYSLNTRVEIYWDNGTKEAWKLTWRDDTINKLEPYYLNAAADWRDFYLENPAKSPDGGPYSPYFFQRNPTADNVGFALGCQRSFETLKQDTSSFQGKYWGWVFRSNPYCVKDENGECVSEGRKCENVNGTCWSPTRIKKVDPWTQRLGPEYPEASYELTTTDVWRDVQYEADNDQYVFSYIDIPRLGNTGLKSGRVYSQVDHESNGNGHIEDETGHIYLGFQVADSNDDVRGFVFVEAEWDPAVGFQRYTQMSAMYLLDDSNTEAKTGIMPDPLF